MSAWGELVGGRVVGVGRRDRVSGVGGWWSTVSGRVRAWDGGDRCRWLVSGDEGDAAVGGERFVGAGPVSEDAGAFDVLATMETTPGRRLAYDDLAPRATVVEVSGVRVRVAALSDIIASKETADRAKDREALPELRWLAAQRTASGSSVPPCASPPPPSS